MAMDTALLESVPDNAAIFRHYNWENPAVTFGYAQRIREVKTVAAKNIHLCRRPTGGGIVDHRNDWTYSLTLGSRFEAAQKPPTELYADIHYCVQQALNLQDIPAQLAPCPRSCQQPQFKSQISNFESSAPSQCFMQPVANDVIHPDGQKIAGAAMKRTRQGLLIQGSINRETLPGAFDFQSFSTTFPKTLANNLGLNRETTPLHSSPADEAHIERLRQCFESDTWTYRR